MMVVVIVLVSIMRAGRVVIVVARDSFGVQRKERRRTV